jgi:arginine utilization regulatory protein
MRRTPQKGQSGRLDLDQVDFLPVLTAFDEGVIIADISGRIIYYNATMGKIDDLSPDDVLGKKVIDVYDLTDETSMLMRCLQSGRSIVNHTFFYRTRLGKVVNTICSTFPLYKRNRLIGAICFVKDYRILERTIATIARPQQKKDLGNGTRFTFADVIGEAPQFLKAVKCARMAAASPSPVMLYGETGTGKELFAQSMHNFSPRAKKPYVAVNCAAIPENLLEGILFGTSRGAFTGATDRPGLFERANGGTLFLDEVDSMPTGLQAKLLRVLQEKRTRRVGSLTEVQLELKVISSVGTEPHQAVQQGRLRLDLFYRLGVVYIRLPALREREGDLEGLVRHFIHKYNSALGKQVRRVSDEVMALFKGYQWPGNVRELEHVIEGSMNMVGHKDVIETHDLSAHFACIPKSLGEAMDPDDRPSVSFVDRDAAAESEGQVRFTLSETRIPLEHGKSLAESQADQERDAVRQALSKTEGNVTRAARILGISRQLLHYKLKKYGFSRDHFVAGNTA